MNMKTHNEASAEIEQLIDELGFEYFLGFVSGICYEKAAHIQASYGDQALSKQWERRASALQRVR